VDGGGGRNEKAVEENKMVISTNIDV